MRPVCYVCDQFPAITQTFTIKETAGLEAAGLDLQVVAMRVPAGLPPELEPLAARTHVLRVGGAAPAALLRRPRALALLAGPPRSRVGALARGTALAAVLGRGDHVHAQFPLEASSAAYVASRLAGCTFSFSGHTYHRLDLMAEKLAAASFVTVGSEFERDLLARRYGERWRDRIHVRRLGVPERPQRGTHVPSTIVAVGTLTGKKGHDVLIRAVGELVRRGVDAQLELVGEGPQRGELEELARAEGIEGNVSFAGALPPSVTLERVAAAAVFALGCRETADGDHDCLPVALMDAMSLGVPTVSSLAFGIPELIEDGVSGLLAPPGDAVALADRLESVLDDVALGDRLGRAGRLAVRERYDLDRNVAALAELFRERLA